MVKEIKNTWDRINPLKLLSAKDKLNCQVLQLTKENMELKASFKASQEASKALSEALKRTIEAQQAVWAEFSKKWLS